MFVQMPTTFVRTFAMGAVVMSFGLALPFQSLAAQGQTASDNGKPSRVVVSAPDKQSSADDGARSLQQKDPPQQDDSNANWPTDDFGRPLRGCDVPWDLVPRK